MTLPLVGVRRPARHGGGVVRMSSHANRLAQPLEGPALRGILRTSSPERDDTIRVSGTAITESAMVKRTALHHSQSHRTTPHVTSRLASLSPRTRPLGGTSTPRRLMSASATSRSEPKVYTQSHTTLIRPAEKIQMYRTPKHRSTQILHPEGMLKPVDEESAVVKHDDAPKKGAIPAKGSGPHAETPTFRQKESRSSSKIVAPPRLQKVHPGYLAMNTTGALTPSETVSSVPQSPTHIMDHNPYAYGAYPANLPPPFNRYVPQLPWPHARGASVAMAPVQVMTPLNQSRRTSMTIKRCEDCNELKRKVTELERQAESARLQLEKQREQARLQQEYYRSGQGGAVNLQPAKSQVSPPQATPAATAHVSAVGPAPSVNPVWPPSYGGQVRISKPRYLESSYTTTTSSSMITPRQPPRRRKRPVKPQTHKHHRSRRHHRSLSFSTTSSSSSSSSSLSSHSRGRVNRSPHNRRKSASPVACKCKHRSGGKHSRRKMSVARHVSMAPVQHWRMPSVDQVPAMPLPDSPIEPQTITGETQEAIKERLDTIKYVHQQGTPGNQVPLQSVRMSDASYTTISNLRPVGSKPRRTVCCA